MSHSQFHCTGRAYLDMHGLIFETSICYWQGPYHPERARSRLISEAKQGRAWLVLGWETAWEYRVL